MADARFVVGIDLGTTHTVVAFAPIDARRVKTAPDPTLFNAIGGTRKRSSTSFWFSSPACVMVKPGTSCATMPSNSRLTVTGWGRAIEAGEPSVGRTTNFIRVT